MVNYKGERIYVFGGYQLGSCLSTIRYFNIPSNEWITPMVKGMMTGLMNAHMNLWKDKDTFVIYGGED